MKRRLSFKGVVAALIMIALVAGMAHTPLQVLLVAVALAVSVLAPKPLTYLKNAYRCGIDKEIWVDYIDENLYKDNGFLEKSDDHGEYVNNLAVHSPQAGDDGTVVVNRTIFPATATQRVDTTVDWYIDEFTVDPWKISNAEEVQLSYNKIDSMLSSRRAILDEKIADNALYKWSPTGTATLPNGGGTNNNILRSSGIPNNDITQDKKTSAVYLPGATGLRLLFTLYDIRMAKLWLDLQNVPKTDRHIMLSSNAANQVIDDLIATKYRDAMTQYNASTGELSMIMGFNVHIRSTVVRYNNADTPVVKAPAAVAAAADNDTILFWHQMAVRRAKGETIVYNQDNNPLYFGHLFSLLKRFGGTISRTSEVGVGAIVQAVPVGVGS